MTTSAAETPWSSRTPSALTTRTTGLKTGRSSEGAPSRWLQQSARRRSPNHVHLTKFATYQSTSVVGSLLVVVVINAGFMVKRLR